MTVDKKYNDDHWTPLQAVAMISFVLILITGCSYGLAIGFSTPAEDARKSDESESVTRRPKYSERQSEANRVREAFLATEEKLRSKYALGKRSNTNTTRDRQTSHRTWREQKEKTKKFLSRMGADRSGDRRSVQAGLKQSLQRLNEDRPDRL